MKIELSWEDDDAICSSEEEARAAWNDGVKYVLWRRDDGQDLRIVVNVPCEFDDLKKAWEDPSIYDGYQTDMEWVLKYYPDFPEPEDDDEEDEPAPTTPAEALAHHDQLPYEIQERLGHSDDDEEDE